jgi:hypothetical protein
MAGETFDQPGLTWDQPGLTWDAAVPSPGKVGRMAKVKLGLGELTEDEILDLVQTIITSMTGNPNFPNPTPSLAAITAARADAAAKKAAADQARAEAELKTTEKNEAFEVLEGLLSQLTSYVENASGGVPSRIESAAMGVRAPRSPVGKLPAPVNLLVEVGGTDGELRLKWKSVPKNKGYKIQFATGDTPTNWQELDTCSKATYVATGLTSGTKYWFRVAALSSAGTGGWSDPACRVAP